MKHNNQLEIAYLIGVRTLKEPKFLQSAIPIFFLSPIFV